MTLALGMTGLPDPQVLSAFTDDFCSEMVHVSAATGNAFTTAGTAIYVPVRISQPHTYVKAWWMNGTTTVAGNVDVGIYTLSGTTMTRVVASTAEAQAGAATTQVSTTFTSTTIGPGLYYLAISSSSTGTFRGINGVANNLPLYRAFGIFMSATSSPLPSTATVTATTQLVIPIYGISELATI